jgi:ABC-type molybdate transport system ATPase subunit
VIIADEVLGVGDEAFQRKCSHHVLQFLKDGGTMVLATHNLYLAERLCQTAIWLDAGKVRAQGNCHEVTKAYRAHLECADASDVEAVSGTGADADPLIWIDGQPRRGATLQFSMPLRIVVGAKDRARIEVRRPNGTLVLSAESLGVGTSEIAHPWLLPGQYFVRLVGQGDRVLDEIPINCVGERRELGTVYLEHQWT